MVGHLHHGLRGPEADLDRDLASEVAARIGAPFVLERVDLPALRGARGGRRASLEVAGRRERYRFFVEAARARGLGKVALGHQRDDQVETVLHRILRGTGIRGLAGIPRRRPLAPGGPVAVRPLLDLGRADVEAYLAARGARARTDRTNLDPGHATRNRLRLEVLPALRRAFPAVDEALLRLAGAAALARAWLEADARRRLGPAGPASPLALPVAVVRDAPPAVRPVLLALALEEAYGVSPLARHLEALHALCESPRSGGSIALPRGLVARREYDRLVIEPATGRLPLAPPAPAPTPTPAPAPAPSPTPAPAPAPLPLPVPSSLDAPALDVTIETRRLDALPPGPWPPRDPLVAYLDATRIAAAGPLSIRRPRPGDAFYPAGGPGRRKLQDFFVDRKVPRPERARALVLLAGSEVAWVVGHRLDERFRARPEEAGAVISVRVGPRAAGPRDR